LRKRSSKQKRMTGEAGALPVKGESLQASEINPAMRPYRHRHRGVERSWAGTCQGLEIDFRDRASENHVIIQAAPHIECGRCCIRAWIRGEIKMRRNGSAEGNLTICSCSPKQYEKSSDSGSGAAFYISDSIQTYIRRAGVGSGSVSGRPAQRVMKFGKGKDFPSLSCM
jgi:hypothetical protein